MNKVLTLSLIFFLGIFFFSTSANAQVEEGQWYSPDRLSQEGVNITKELYPTTSLESGDTTMTVYGDASVEFKIFFVNGSQYDNIFNPNPTGILLNGKEFYFYCGIEKTIRQNYSNVLEAKEFEYLGKKYLMLISFREDCLGDNCQYRCYNLFDITNSKRIFQTSFSSIYQGVDSFGEFNNDGKLDFLRFAPKPKEGAPDDDSHYLITAYTLGRSMPKQLTDGGNTYYLYAEGEPEGTRFQVLQAYWFFGLKDSKGETAEPTPYFAEYISFDPLYRYLYNPDGVRIEKNRWSIHVTDVGDLEAAQEYCRQIQTKSFEDVFIMIDQYSGDITYQVYVGNFINKEGAVNYQERLAKNGIRGDLADFKNMY
ncbi:SPOR domain-containing protein [Limibacter armeniacum]|uniref:SPOR domain-containing protein n=1 Tax=Limibacter armeniacum TaxID=466084 RepID=UPI002FE62F43